MRCLVCGGRDFGKNPKVSDEKKNEYEFVYKTLGEILHPIVTDDIDTWLPPKDLTIISGGASGVDSIAIDWAVVNWVNFEVYKADWRTYGKSAGMIRNKQMLDSGIDLVIAFPGGKGTANMVAIARQSGVSVKEIFYTGGSCGI